MNSPGIHLEDVVKLTEDHPEHPSRNEDGTYRECLVIGKFPEGILLNPINSGKPFLMEADKLVVLFPGNISEVFNLSKDEEFQRLFSEDAHRFVAVKSRKKSTEAEIEVLEEVAGL